MGDDFMDLLSGEDAKPQKDEKGMGDLLGGLMGGGGDAGGLGDLLGALMGGAASGSSSPDANMGGMADLLGGLMGGDATPESAPSAGSAGGMGGLLGGLLGGGGAGGLGGLLGGLMGGGAADQMSFGGGSGGMSLPFAGTLAEKLGISEQTANMLIMGAIGLLTSSMAKNRSSGEIDYQRVADPEFIRSSGVAGRLSSQMGISEDEAILGLQQTMGLMVPGAQPAAKKPAAKKPAAKKTTAKKTTAKKTPPAGTGAPKKAKKKKSNSDFMDLLDDTTR